MVGTTAGTVAPAGSRAAEPPLRARILDATVRCVARAGVAKTTIDDIARAASCSRATVYRTFAGGRDSILVAAGTREVQRFLDRLDRRLTGCATVEEILVAGISDTARQLVEHEALHHIVVNEPDVLRPMLAFDGLDPILACAAAFAEGHLGRVLAPDLARATGEWAARLVLAYAHDPLVGPAPLDLADEAVTRRIVRAFLLPGITTTSQE